MSRTRRTQPKADTAKSQQANTPSWPDFVPGAVLLVIIGAVLAFHLLLGDVVWRGDLVASGVDVVVIEFFALLANSIAMSPHPNGGEWFLFSLLIDSFRVLILVLIVAPILSRWLLGMPLNVDQWLETGLWTAGFMAMFYVAQMAIIIVHEAGHAIADFALYHTVTAMRIGPVQLNFQCGQKHLDWAKGNIDGGLTEYNVTTDRAPRFRQAIVSSAGVFAQLMLAVFVGLVAYSLPQVLPASLQQASWLDFAGITPTWTELLRFLLVALIAFALANGLSNLMAHGSLDGKKLRDALRGGEDFEHDFNNAFIGDMSDRHIRPRCWPAERAERLMFRPNLSDDFVNLPQYRLLYFWHLDRHEYEEAGAMLDLVIVWGLLDVAMRAEIAYFIAQHRRQKSQAILWINQARGYLERQKDGIAVLKRAEAAIALAKGDLEAARVAAREGLAAMELEQTERKKKQCKPSGIDIMRMEQLQEIAQLAAQ